MERLTMWYDGNHAICENEECTSGDCPFADPICEQVQNIIDRLAAYEDTGLEPEEIGALKSREKGLVELLNGVSCGCAVTYTRLRKLAQADREWRCFIGPFVAMIEQSLSGGEMKPQRDQRFNGRYAVVYFDPKKWYSPLIDICGTPYNREEAEERMKVLKAALRREQE
nr:MAG TPA: hypothetical protein [Caudoviricetes sp.]